VKPPEGFVLIAALWIVVAVTAIELHIAAQIRSDRLGVANSLESSRALAAAEAGVELARSRLNGNLHASSFPTGEAVLQLLGAGLARSGVAAGSSNIGPARFAFRLRDTGESLNLNHAGEEQLRRFLRGLRIDWGLADRIAQATMDWRDPDSAHRPRGAERDDYLRLGALAIPENGPFADAAEFRYVMGVTPEIYELVRPYLTIDGPGLIDVNTAPEPVLLSLPGMTPEAAAVLIERRSAGYPVRTVQELSDLLPPIARQVFLPEIPQFIRLATFHPLDLIVESVGWVEGSPIRVHITAQLLPAGRTVLVPWRRIH
jgi:general secretion pathway protein K